MTTSSFESHIADSLSIEVSGASLIRMDSLLAARLTRARAARFRGWRIAAAAALMILVVPLAAVATAGIRHTEDPFGVVDAKGFQAEVDAAKEAVALPAGASWPPYLVADPDAGYSRNGGRSWVEGVAFCRWMDAWLNATESADIAAATTARDTLLTVPTWVLYTGPFGDQSYRDVLDASLAGVSANNPQAAREASRPACSGA